ncbi:phosphatidate cytidylyltransferase [Acinetobacter larvae]|uniref:Phosphatidate cytidylyltransferase n=1 Tax=Acinetobacter larvae TaxID=1789224 RepID=A0A1B2M0C0_9GAMM|nr:CDP-archaeol synthase [Acinetobacter larvae]AOA58654.1 phosphatidate cytidylyltransferase [Acinetobacter larvae]
MIERIITALVLVAVVFFCMFYTTSHYPMLILMVAAAGAAGYEWFKLMPHPEQSVNKVAAAAFGFVTALLSLLTLNHEHVGLVLWVASIFIWLLSIYWVKHYPRIDHWYCNRLYPMGVILIAAAVSAIYMVWQMSPWWLMYLFLLVWGADSGAYFVGRKLGRRKLAPHVSPNKTIEGLLGGIVTVALVIIVVQAYFLSLSLLHHVIFLVISIITVFSSVLGDLFESMIKRRAGIKDSGRILPGHGGVLDRIDSLLAAAPIFAVGIIVLQLIGVNL